MKTVLVTGGAGFLGSALVQRLVKEGFAVRVLDDLSRGHPKRLARVVEDITLIHGDIREASVVEEAVKGVDLVCHLAYINGTKHFYERPREVLEVGIKGMLHVLDACVKHGVKHLVTASSSEVYQAPPHFPTKEEVPLVIPDVSNPRYSYGGGKIMSELMTLHYGKEFFERALIFRPHNVYGADMGSDHVIPELMLKIQHSQANTPAQQPVPLTIQGDGTQQRAFVYIDDFTDGLWQMIDEGKHLGIYHIGTQEEVCMKDLALEIGKVMGVELALQTSPMPKGGTLRRVPCIDKLKTLGYAPKISLTQGLQRVYAWFRQNNSA